MQKCCRYSVLLPFLERALSKCNQLKAQNIQLIRCQQTSVKSKEVCQLQEVVSIQSVSVLQCNFSMYKLTSTNFESARLQFRNMLKQSLAF